MLPRTPSEKPKRSSHRLSVDSYTIRAPQSRAVVAESANAMIEAHDSVEWILAGGGQAAATIRKVDWGATALGPIRAWPNSLKTLVATLLRSRHPMFLFWGPELIQFYNDAYLPSFGVGKHPAAMGQRGRDCWPEIWSVIGPQIEGVMERGEATWQEDSLVPIFRNGAIEDVYWTYGYSPVFDETGRIAGTLVVCTETTRRITAQHQFEVLVESIPQLAWGARPDGHIDWYNRRWYEYTGTQFEDMQGWGWTSVHSPALVDAVVAKWTAALQAGEPFEMEFPLRRHDGAFRWHLTRALPVTDAAGRIVRWFGTNTDVHDSRLAEAERANLLESEQAARRDAELASRAMDDFLSTASHELRTPLNAILGWIRMLRAGTLDQRTAERALESIERNSRAQIRLIEDILDGSRIITGKLTLEMRTVDLAALLHTAVEVMRPVAEQKQVELSVSTEVSRAPVLGDPERLQQVVWNLVSNAVKFTPKNGRVSVLLRRTTAGLQLAVADTGQGISADFLPQVFERFSQAEGSSSRRYGGLGMGLALVRHLVEAHGGTVTAESAGEGQGALFTVTLPAAQAEDLPVETTERITLAPPNSIPSHSGLQGVTALVVDDERDARELVAMVLRASGADVTVAADAGTALGLMAAHRFTVLVSDIGMPGTDGYALIRQVRALDSERQGGLRAVAVTAYARDADRRRAMETGFDSYISKPVDPDELVRLVARLAASSQLTKVS